MLPVVLDKGQVWDKAAKHVDLLPLVGDKGSFEKRVGEMCGELGGEGGLNQSKRGQEAQLPT